MLQPPQESLCTHSKKVFDIISVKIKLLIRNVVPKSKEIVFSLFEDLNIIELAGFACVWLAVFFDNASCVTSFINSGAFCSFVAHSEL